MIVFSPLPVYSIVTTEERSGCYMMHDHCGDVDDLIYDFTEETVSER